MTILADGCKSGRRFFKGFAPKESSRERALYERKMEVRTFCLQLEGQPSAPQDPISIRLSQRMSQHRSISMPLPFWQRQALVGGSSKEKQSKSFLPREVRLTLFSIFRRAARRSPSFRKKAKKQRSRCSGRVSLLARNRLPVSQACDWPRPRLLPAVEHSRLSARK